MSLKRVSKSNGTSESHAGSVSNQSGAAVRKTGLSAWFRLGRIVFLVVMIVGISAAHGEPKPSRMETPTEGSTEGSTQAGDSNPVSAWLDKTVTASETVAASETVTTAKPKASHTLQRREARDGKRVAPNNHRSASTVDMFDMVWPLGIVLVLVSLCVWGLRKWMPKSVRFGGGDTIRILSRKYLSGKQSLCLARIGRRVVLIGVTPDRISAISEITEPEEVASLVAAVERGRPDSFTSTFNNMSDQELADEAEGRDLDDPIEEEAAVSSHQLARTGREMRELVNRVRALSTSSQTPAESASRLATRS